jgi:hypothetical protein
MDDLNMPERRDPDALPPRNALESAMNFVYHALAGLTRGNVVYAIKAAVMTGSFLVLSKKMFQWMLRIYSSSLVVSSYLFEVERGDVV